MNVIARFYLDCGRMGEVSGQFITTKEELESNYGKKYYFGEILGKHSEVYGVLEPQDITIVTEDQNFINKYIELFVNTTTGYNPLEYMEDDE